MENTALTKAQIELLAHLVRSARNEKLIKYETSVATDPVMAGSSMGSINTSDGEIKFLMSDIYALRDHNPPLLRLDVGCFEITEAGFQLVSKSYATSQDKEPTRARQKPNWIGIIALFVAVSGTILSFMVPEVRHVLGLDKAQSAQNLTELATLPSAGAAISTGEFVPTVIPPTAQVGMIGSDGASRIVVISPECNCGSLISTVDAIVVRLRFAANTEKLAERGADRINYTLFIDAQELTSIDEYRRQAVYEEKSILPDDPTGAWWVYWDIPIDPMTAGDHIIKAQLTTRNSIDNGYETLSAGTAMEYVATVSVVPAINAP